MKLLLVTGTFPQRSETFIYRKAVALAERGHEVTVAARGTGEWALYPAPLPATMRVQLLPPDHSLRDPRRGARALRDAVRVITRSPSGARKLYHQCAKDAATSDARHRQFLRHLPFVAARADVIHFEFVSLAAMYPLVGGLVEAPIVVSCRGTDVHELELRPEAEQRAMLTSVREADAVHCVAREIADEVTRLSGRRDGLCVNRPAVDTDSIRPPVSRERRDVIRILATGRLVWKKGFDYLLTALAEVAREGIAFRCEILGDGALKKSLQFAIDDLGLHDKVELVGGVSSSEVLERMQRTDIFVLSSLAEGISNAVLEAMASGVSIVTTAAGGMTEAVEDGREGFVVPVRDSHALAVAIIRLARDPARRAEMGDAARTRAVREFSITRQVETFEALYESVTRR